MTLLNIIKNQAKYMQYKSKEATFCGGGRNKNKRTKMENHKHQTNKKIKQITTLIKKIQKIVILKKRNNQK